MGSTIERREAQLISKILYKLYSIEEDMEMRKAVLELLPNLVRCRKASFYLGSKEPEHFMDRPVGYCMEESLLYGYLDYDQYDYMNGIFVNSETEVYRETDYFMDEVRKETPYYKDLLEPNNMHYSIQVSLYYSEIFLGVVTLFRGKEDKDFADHDVFLLTLIKDHLALRLYQDYNKINQGKPQSNLQKYIDTYGLTLREVEVIKLIFEGMNNEEMADALHISHFTVQKHVSNIYKKLKVNNKSQLLILNASEDSD